MRIKNKLLLIVMLWWGGIFIGQAQNYARPGIVLDSLVTFSLANQLQVAFVEDHQTPRLHIELVVQGVDIDLAKVVSRSLLSRKSKQSDNTYQEIFESMGIRTASKFGGITLQGIPGKDSIQLATLSEMIESFQLDSLSVAKLQLDLATKSKVMGQEPMDKVNTFIDRMWAPKLDTILGVDSLNCMRYFNHVYHPKKATLVIIGASEKDSILRKWLDGTIGKWAMNRPPVNDSIFDLKSSTYPLANIVQGPISETVFLRYLLPVKYKDALYPEQELEIINFLLGGHPKSYLNENLREANGFSFGMLSRFVKKDSLGWISIQGGVSAEHLGNAIVQINEEINRFGTDLVSRNDLDLAVKSLSNRHVKRLGQPDYVAGLVQQILQDSIDKTHFSEYIENFDSISQQDLLKVANQYLDLTKAKLVLYGDSYQIMEQLNLIRMDTVAGHFDEMGNALDFKALQKLGRIEVDSLVKKYLDAIELDSLALDSLETIQAKWEANYGAAKVTIQLKADRGNRRLYLGADLDGFKVNQFVLRTDSAFTMNAQSKKWF